MSRSSAEGQYQYQSKTAEIEGHEFALREPKFTACKKAVRICLRLIGNPAEMLDDLRELVLNESDPLKRALKLGSLMQVKNDRFEDVPDEDIIELLEIVTDKDAAWFDAHPLSGPGLERLIAEVASILPFDGVWVQKGEQAGAIVMPYLAKFSTTAAKSSESGADGAQTTSPGAESSGPSHAHVALRTGTSEPS